ncbi:MAG: hypothetical protein PF542_04295 [Nanoarchaeota archaeon]|jgi:hypothetical protein|nr:hypothetical protein [Nanoarchaeota archaeon]
MTKKETKLDQSKTRPIEKSALEEENEEEGLEKRIEFKDILSEEEVQRNTLKFQQFLMGEDTNVTLDQREFTPILNLEEDLEEIIPEETPEEQTFIDYNTLEIENHPVYDLGEKKDPTSFGSIKYQGSMTKEHNSLYRTAQEMSELNQNRTTGEFIAQLKNKDESFNAIENAGLQAMSKSYSLKDKLNK